MATNQRRQVPDSVRLKREAQKRRKARKKRKAIIFGVEIVVILVLIVALFFFLTQSEDGNGAIKGPLVTVLDSEELQIDESVVENEAMKGYKNIALFGVDATSSSGLYSSSRSDSMMIASINMETGDIKLVSLYRDTYLNIGDDSYIKCNHAYSYGGAAQAIKMMNMNMDMDIESFVTVGYKGLSEVIDGIGGVYIDVDSEEIKHINNYQIAVAKALGQKDYNPVTETGYQLLDGVQAASYCRIRYTKGDDFKRTERQREVIQAIEEQAKKTDVTKLLGIFNDVIDDVYTNISSDDVIDLIKNINNYHIVDTNGFPQESMRTTATIGAKGSSVIPTNLVSNVEWLHEYLFGDTAYEVSTAVRNYSSIIESQTAEYVQK